MMRTGKPLLSDFENLNLGYIRKPDTDIVR